jgi:integrase
MSGTLRDLPPSKRTGEKRWELRVYVGRDPDKTVRDDEGMVIKQGPPVHVSRVFRGGKREANKALDKLVAEYGGERRIGTSATVGKLFTEWLANLERLGKAQSTLETYKTHVEKHLRPGLGSIRLDKLTVHDVDRYLSNLDKVKGLAPRTIKLDHAVLSAALAQAVDWEWTKASPAKSARLKSADQDDQATLTTDQFSRLYQAALADDVDMAVVIALAALTGCRRGELCGLRWDDLDVDRAALRVERQWVPGTGGQHLTKSTKTGKGRTVFIGATGVALLEQYRAVQTERIGHDPEGWLLSYNGGETEMRAKSMTEYVTRLAKKVKVPAHFHTLRHWAATELVHQGVDLPTAASQLGHSTGVMAETYLHTSDERGAAAGELIAGVVGKSLSLSLK